MDSIPAVVLTLVSTLPQLGPNPPRPFAWRQTQTGWVIVLEDGRKLTFENVSQEINRDTPSLPQVPQVLGSDSRRTSDRSSPVRPEPARRRRKAQ